MSLPTRRDSLVPAQSPTSWRIPPGGRRVPLVIAHRGLSSAVPENTLEAFRAALEAGSDGIELDVRLTKDRQVIVMHDRLVDRTTDGHGPVGIFTLGQIKRLDAGSWFHSKFLGARVPTLDEVFEALPQDLLMDVELKVRGTGVLALVRETLKVVRRHRRFASTLLASFNPLALALVRMLEPRIARGHIWSARHPYPMRNRWLLPITAPHWMNPDRGAYAQALVHRSHRRGRRVMAWDVDAGNDLATAAQQGVDAIVTDHADRFVRQRASIPAMGF